MASNTGIPGITFIPAGGLTTQTIDGIPGGMNLALPAQEIDDTEARYIQDVLVDQPGLARRRGPVEGVANIAALARKGSGLATALNPQGLARFAVLTGDDANGYLTAYSADLSSVVDLTWPHPLPTSPETGASYRNVNTAPALHGGAWVGVSSTFDADSPNQALGLWFGGTKADYVDTITATRGSQAVTGSGFTANVDPGMFLFANTNDPYTAAYIGTVKSVDSDTSLTLISPSPYAATAKSGTFQSLRGFAPKVAKGHLTTDVTTAIVTGGATKFRSQKMDTGTALTGTLTSGSAVVTGLSSTTGLTPGMPVTGTNVGSGARVSTVDSSTQVTLTVNATGSGSSSLTFKVPWDVYRASDGTWVGTVLSVESETGLTLMANAAIAMADEAFVAVRADANFSLVTTGSTDKVGWIAASYADRNWYFNNGADFSKTARGWFSDTADPEIVDMSTFDGDWLDIISTSNVNEPIRGAMAAYNSLLVFKETETFRISGSSPSSFGVQKLEDDGAISNGSIQAYAGGVIWAGREGIHLYDGIQTRNLVTDKLGEYYRSTARTFDPTKYRMWSMVDRDHYFLFMESVQPTVAVVKGNTSTTPTKMTFYINLVTGAVGTLTNVHMRGSVVLPDSAGRTSWYLVNGQQAGDIADHAILCDAEALFNKEGVDPVFSDYEDAVPNWTNLIQNGNFETDASGWTLSAAAAWSSSGGVVGSASLAFTDPAWAQESFSNPVVITPGTYVFSAYVNNQMSDTCRFNLAYSTDNGITWQQDANGLFDSTFAPGYDARYSQVVTFPAGANMYRLRIIADGIRTGVANFDGIQLEAGSTLHEYVDGTGAALGHSGAVAGPDYYIESKKYDGGDGLRLKRFKQLAIWYLAQGGAMKVDTVLGLNNIGQTLTSSFPVSGFTWDTLRGQFATWDALKAQFATWNDLIQSVFVPKRVRFQKKNQYIAFRLYQESSAVTRMQMGPVQIGYKLMRPGRI